MPPSPLTATHRLTVNYTVVTFPHKMRLFCSLTPSGDSTGFDFVNIRGLANIAGSAVCDRWATVLGPFFSTTDTTFDSFIGEERVGTAFVPVFSHVTAIPPSGPGTAVAAADCDITGKDADNLPVHNYYFEGKDPVPLKRKSYAALVAAEKTLVDYFFNTGGVAAAADAWYWRTSRNQVNPVRWLAIVRDSNEKLRRLRKIK